MTRAAWQVEAQTVRNVAEAIERVLAEVGHRGASEAALWTAIESCGVTREVFDAALRVLVTRRVVRRTREAVFPA